MNTQFIISTKTAGIIQAVREAGMTITLDVRADHVMATIFSKPFKDGMEAGLGKAVSETMEQAVCEAYEQMMQEAV